MNPPLFDCMKVSELLLWPSCIVSGLTIVIDVCKKKFADGIKFPDGGGGIISDIGRQSRGGDCFIDPRKEGMWRGFHVPAYLDVNHWTGL